MGVTTLLVQCTLCGASVLAGTYCLYSMSLGWEDLAAAAAAVGEIDGDKPM